VENPLLKPLEDLVNRGISASSEAGALCRRLSGRRLLIDPTGLPGAVTIAAEDDGLRLIVGATTEADCAIRGLPLSLVRAGVSGTATSLRQGAAEVSGDPAVAQDFQRLLDLAKPDWEEELSKAVGDVLAHQLGNAARGLADWGRRAAEALTRDTAEFLSEESRQLPTRFELEEFLEDVDRLRDDVDRCAARIDRIDAKRGGGSS
jgi:ubiquinone biosynthesis protein UbiJ